MMTPDQFSAECRRIVTDHQGHEAHRKLDLLTNDVLSSLGYSEGIAIFEAAVRDWHQVERPYPSSESRSMTTETTPEKARELAERMGRYRAYWSVPPIGPALAGDVASALLSLSDQVERLAGERDEARSMFDKHVAWASDQDTALTKERDALRDALAKKTRCSCGEVAGEDRDCTRHGRFTLWGKENPDMPMFADHLKSVRKENKTMREALAAMDRIVEDSIAENGSPHRLHWREHIIIGPAAEAVYSILRSAQTLARAALNKEAK